MIYPGKAKKNLSGGTTAVTFHFSNSKLKEQPFSINKIIGKYPISKFRGKGPSYHPLRTAMAGTVQAMCLGFECRQRRTRSRHGLENVGYTALST